MPSWCRSTTVSRPSSAPPADALSVDEARRFPLPPVLRNGPAQIMASACRTLGFTATDAPAAVVSRDFTVDPAVPERKACINCGFCHQGCRTRAKASMDVTTCRWPSPAGPRSAPRHRMPRGRARQGRADHGRDLPQRRARDIASVGAHGPVRGAVETPRLLLHLDLARQRQVGRNYIGHVATQVWGTFADEVGMNRGYPSSLITEDLHRPKGAELRRRLLGAEPRRRAADLGELRCPRSRPCGARR